MALWNGPNRRGAASPDSGDAQLATAIALEQIDVHYQPLIEPGTGRVVGAEALARARIADGAADLFARAAGAGLAERLSRLVQRKALHEAAAWQGPLRGLALSLNLLPAEIASDGFAADFLSAMDAAGMNPNRVILEITENAQLAADGRAANQLAQLRRNGVRTAIDDFGTGFASMAYLTSLPLDFIKIDAGLIRQIAHCEPDRVVVRGLIRLARELDLKVIVEGVEDSAQLALLNDWGCDLYQGFLSAAALSQDDLLDFVAKQNCATAA